MYHIHYNLKRQCAIINRMAHIPGWYHVGQGRTRQNCRTQLMVSWDLLQIASAAMLPAGLLECARQLAKKEFVKE